MRRLLIALTAGLLFSGACAAAERVYLSRTLSIDFRQPGKILRIDQRGETPVAEEGKANSYVLILPKRIILTVSMGRDNPEGKGNLIGLTVKDELAPAQKTSAFMIPTDLTKMLWLDVYRYQVTMVQKEFDERGFVKATIRIDVYAPEAQPQPNP